MHVCKHYRRLCACLCVRVNFSPNCFSTLITSLEMTKNSASWIGGPGIILTCGTPKKVGGSQNLSLLEWWSILDSEPSGPKQQNHTMDSTALGDFYWFLLICWLSPFHFQQFPAQVQTKGAHAHLARCSDAWGPWWAASRWGHARPVAAAALSDEERSLKMS